MYNAFNDDFVRCECKWCQDNLILRETSVKSQDAEVEIAEIFYFSYGEPCDDGEVYDKNPCIEEHIYAVETNIDSYPHYYFLCKQCGSYGHGPIRNKKELRFWIDILEEQRKQDPPGGRHE